MNRTLFVLGMVGVLFLLPASSVVAEEVTADDYMQLWMPLVGEWKVTIEAGDTSSEGTWKFGLSKTKKCFASYGEGGILPASEALHGYCPAKKQWTIVSFDAEGGTKHTVGIVEDMKKGKELTAGLTVKWKDERFVADGTKHTTSSTMAFSEVSQKRIVIQSKDQTEDGEAKPGPAKMILERVSPNK